MPNSLRAKISKLRHKGEITQEEYNELITKLDGHDEQIRADERAKVIDEIFNLADSADMDSNYIYLEFDKDKYNPPFMRTREELKKWFKYKLKE